MKVIIVKSGCELTINELGDQLVNVSDTSRLLYLLKCLLIRLSVCSQHGE